MTLQNNEKRVIDEINALKGEKKFAPVYETAEKKQSAEAPRKNKQNGKKKKGGNNNSSGYQGRKK